MLRVHTRRYIWIQFNRAERYIIEQLRTLILTDNNRQLNLRFGYKHCLYRMHMYM